MKEFLLVFKFLLIQNLSLKHFINKLKHDKRQRNVYIFVLIVLLLSLPSFGYFIKMYVNIFDVLKSINQSSVFIMLAIMTSVIIITLFGMFQIISYFYFSNEVKILTTYPIKTNHILLSKFFVIYIIELLISIFTVLPFFIIYGINMNIGVIHWIYLIISFFILPIIPLVLIGIITVYIMRITKVFKNRDVIRMIGMAMILIFVLGIQIGINRFVFTIPEGSEQEYISNLINNNNFIVDKVGIFYPVIILVNDAISASLGKATISIIILIIASMLAVRLFTIVLNAVFLKTYLSEQESISPKKSKKIKRNQKVSKVSLTITKIDFITLLKVPIYAFNCLSMIFIIPILLLIMPFAYGASGLDGILGMYEDNNQVFWLIVSLGIAIFSTLNQIASTTFSREGKTNWIMRTLPISAKDHILGRFYTAFFAQITFSILTIGLLAFIIKQDLLYAILSFGLSILAAIPLLLIGIYIDLKRPMLKWDNPQQAVKQNLNVLVSMATGMIYGLICILLYLGLSKLINYTGIIALFIISNLILTNISYKLLHKNFEKSLIQMG